MTSDYHSAPSLPRLLQRLSQLGIDYASDSADDTAAAINAALADQAVCSRAVVDGKQRCMKFCEYWAHVYQRKWVYVRQEERVKPITALTTATTATKDQP